MRLPVNIIHGTVKKLEVLSRTCDKQLAHLYGGHLRWNMFMAEEGRSTAIGRG